MSAGLVGWRKRGRAMILCFDIGGSRIKAALADGSVLEPLGECATPAGDFGGFVAALAGFVRPGVRHVSISVAGVVDPDTGRIKVANIPCLDGRCVAADLTAALGLPVLVLNDADCFALAEARRGAGLGHGSVFGIILGTGVGGGLVLQGRLVRGAGGYAGEWGHGPVVQHPALACGCGQVGCLDTVGGARGLERLALALEGVVMTSEAIVQGWRAGDAVAGRVVAAWLALVGGQLAMLVNVLGVTCVPVGGGLANAVDLIAALDGTVRAGILRRTDAPLVVPAVLGPDAGLIGAAEAGDDQA